MRRHLCISVTFLDSLFHGKGNYEQPEWPPSPMRLFQALLSGARTGCRNMEWSAGKANAFRWLAGREPPLIVAPEARRTLGYTLYVPNNDSDQKFERQERLTTKIARPHRLCHGDTMHYLWPIEENDWPAAMSHAEVVCREARHLLAVGWGIDQMVGNGRIVTDAETAALMGQPWQAWRTYRPDSQTWRVPRPDSLDDLEHAYKSFAERVRGKQYSPEVPFKGFETICYISAQAVPPRSYAVFELQQGVAFRQENTAAVAAMLRSLACRSAKDDTHQFPGGAEVYVAGHVGSRKDNLPRFSYLPLPTIGYERADGMIRRLLVAEPYGGDGAHARWAQERLQNASLLDEDRNERGLILDPWRSTTKSMIPRYVSQARAWNTVTPVILPGFDDGKHRKAERLFLAASRDAGLPIDAVAELTLRKAPFWPGAQHPRQYAVPDYLKHLPAWHVHVVLREPVPGPLALGAGRHCGLGTFAISDG